MFGKARPSWCPVCNSPPGPDCPDRGRSKRQVKRAENKQWRKDYTDEELYPELEEDNE